MSGIKGILTLSYTDPVGGSRDLAALRDATVSIGTAMLDAANPDGYGWEYSVPGAQRWTASAGLLHVLEDGTTSRKESQRRLDVLAMSRTLLPVTFVAASGVTYTGSARVEQWDVTAAVGAAMSGSYSFRGVGALVLTEPTE